MIEPSVLLLAPQDFPESPWTEVQRLGPRETRDGGRAAQTVLEGDSLSLFQSAVLFPSDNAAHQALQALRYGVAGQPGEPVADGPRYGEESLEFVGQQGAEEAVSLLFRRGPVFVRLTLAGTKDMRTAGRYAQRADEKVKTVVGLW